MNVEKFKLDHNTSYDSIAEGFFGYSIGDEVFHYKSNLPNINELFENISNNCGVFCAIKKDNGVVNVFTDPLAQYPIFIYSEANKFCVSNDFFETSSYTAGQLNKEAIFDCLSYYSPLMNQTIINGCHTTKPFSFIQIDYNKEVPTLTQMQIEIPATDMNYQELLDVLAQRAITRAGAILKNHKPVVHLTGGLDSRLALSAIIKASSNSDDYSVFCFGDGNSQDKLVFNHICDKFNLVKGEIVLNGSNIKSIEHLRESSISFSGLKFTNQTNYITHWTPSHSEVTGYFSEGLIKGFGNYYYNGAFNPFRYQSSISSLPDFIFNSSAFRALSTMSEGRRFKNLTLENYLYLSNRSKCHFGMHSVVNNQSHHSFDIIYDPMLISLFERCPYDSSSKQQGAIVVDLICKIFGEELALLPLAGKSINKYRDDFEYLPSSNCFQQQNFPVDVNDKVLGTRTTAMLTKTGNIYYGKYEELLRMVNLKAEYRDFLSTFLTYSEHTPAVEVSAIRSLVGYLSVLTEA
ncbi:hypothetical protein [Aeromonas sp. MdU4]|uniref:hypothetical protein n=1 Tax=Aeromonas sp. MdU4 TaxID=3342819 RepID=UPI0035B6C33C